MFLYLPRFAWFHIKMMGNYKFLTAPLFRNSLSEEYIRKRGIKAYESIYSLPRFSKVLF